MKKGMKVMPLVVSEDNDAKFDIVDKEWSESTELYEGLRLGGFSSIDEIREFCEENELIMVEDFNF